MLAGLFLIEKSQAATQDEIIDLLTSLQIPYIDPNDFAKAIMKVSQRGVRK